MIVKACRLMIQAFAFVQEFILKNTCLHVIGTYVKDVRLNFLTFVHSVKRFCLCVFTLNQDTNNGIKDMAFYWRLYLV